MKRFLWDAADTAFGLGPALFVFFFVLYTDWRLGLAMGMVVMGPVQWAVHRNDQKWERRFTEMLSKLERVSNGESRREEIEM